MEAERKSNKIRDIVRLHQLLQKWRKQAKASKTIKKTQSFSETEYVDVPKGYLAVSVGKQYEQKKRFVIPTQYLSHQAFGFLLREAEHEFGFQQQGVLQIPCDIGFFETILNLLGNHKVEDEEHGLLFFQFNGNFVYESSILQVCT